MPYGVSESFILGLIAAAGTMISLTFTAMRQSRCTNISCFCIKCSRQILTKEEIELEKLEGGGQRRASV